VGGGKEGGEIAGDDNNNQQPQGQQQQTTQPVQLTKVSILPGASAEGNPDYDPENLNVPMGVGIQWINYDNAPHTVASLKDDGKSFESSIILPNGNYTLDTSTLDESEYEYFCTLHPYMKAKFTMGTDAAANASGPNSQNNSGTGNISTAAGSKQQAASGTNENTTENISNENNSTEGIINAAKNNSINEPQVSSANGTSVTNMSTGTSTPSISTVSIVSGSSLPSNGEFYVPETVETTVGSMINWKNDDFGPHTVTSGDMTTGKTGVFDSNIMQKGSTFSFLFDKVGEYDYFCTLHPFMTGRISVK
ncbi:MAG TPA: plastocyanin/azurin family copper-binding protein, partial [Nitrososphaeraceae archaeon]|nr:plastocyanin/azurin family copper-binding protein [Nitrososphaeraceae archaeon]